MIEARHLIKEYKTGDLTQRALDDVSITFRDSEFVSILGPSGSGKTTLLNILGGLDRPDSGQLVINGKSTKEFKGSDWETYRNHSVGFVFQSYNLIPHQDVLSNVELALKISGQSKAKRKQKAIEALKMVGLADHIHKMPYQMSGGQMQRVAIARALVNNPDIVMADEPTGALDTETGIQVMDILKEISKDRLVIMVTHNPELSERYATRTIRLLDGKIESDSMPIEPSQMAAVPAADGNVKKASMGFLTALALSFANLMSKKGRTFLTAFAGSIGIMGISAILAVSTGVNDYIAKVEQDTLSAYPLSITKNTANLTSLFSDEGISGVLGSSSDTDEDDTQEVSEDDYIEEEHVLGQIMDTLSINNLAAFKDYIEDNREEVESYTNVIDYDYGITPQIYAYDTKVSAIEGLKTDESILINSEDNDNSKNKEDGEKSTPKTGAEAAAEEVMLLNGSDSLSGFSAVSSNFGFSIGTGSAFSEMIDNTTLLDSQYDVLAGRWANDADEAVLVLSPDGSISDFTLYHIGVLNKLAYDNGLNKMGRSESFDFIDPDVYMTYSDALSLTYKVIPKAYCYKYNNKTKSWVDKSSDNDYMKKQLEKGITMKVVGVVRLKDDIESGALSEGIAFSYLLGDEVIRMASQTKIVNEQLADEDVDVFTGKTFDELNEENANLLDLSKLFNVDEEKLKNAFSVDEDAAADAMNELFSFDFDISSLSKAMENSDISDAMESMTSQVSKEISSLPAYLLQQGIEVDEDDSALIQSVLQDMIADLMSGYVNYAIEEIGDDVSASDINLSYSDFVGKSSDEIRQMLIEELGGLVPSQEELSQLASDYLALNSSQKVIDNAMDELTDGLKDSKTVKRISKAVEKYLKKHLAKKMKKSFTKIITALVKVLGSQIGDQISSNFGDISTKLYDTMQNVLSIDVDALAGAFKINMSEEELSQIIGAFLGTSAVSAEDNLVTLGYHSVDEPITINFYPKDFDSKILLEDFIAEYNDKMEATGATDKKITYSDIMGAMLSSITKIVHMVSFVLIAFVSVSLIVSSIMIGIITYISVLERRKEIGILRAMGASKINIANIFNAETIIEGLIAGIIAVSIVYILSPIANSLIYNAVGVESIVRFPVPYAIMMVGISVLLTFIAGLIPSTAASRKDPVEALRSE